ncbi:MAG: glutamine-hydrolyzing GMP synthase [candidate division WOR-3 bacterium]|nr:glutamine-hydrolyzing GMP synthase [candidate division WOR-3 bacterium]MCR4423990.1 glutamine-hydrolyzing GMP synthase [candidate division WOR-3 bacterium]MDH7519591.1 glutamine-hydrolyzing GMP synthase [bacterium]
MDKVLVLDFGSQYTQLIARRVRELRVFSEIVPFNIAPEEILERQAKALILSGGPASVFAPKAPLPDRAIFSLGIPLLGICYGMQVTAYLLGGKVTRNGVREYGGAQFEKIQVSPLFAGLPQRFRVWMSHGDSVTRLPAEFVKLGKTGHLSIAAMGHEARRIYGVQFHPEVEHTPLGKKILENFLFRIARCQPEWTMQEFIAEKTAQIRNTVGKERVLCAVSGGVDSTVLATLLYRAIGRQLVAVFVDNGLLRAGEAEMVLKTLRGRLPVRFVPAAERFLNRLKGVTDPEKKRKIIGNEFIRVFEDVARQLGGIKFLAQGTLYPDLIESRSAFGGPSATIKTHHNVGGLPKDLKFKLIEPLKELFKDEVRRLGRALRIPKVILGRHPFPGPGLAVRILGAVTPERLKLVRAADEIFITELRRAGYYDKVWQALCVLLPVRSVGVMGDERTYENVVALRAVTSTDAMTADWARLPEDLLARIAARITNEVPGINRVVYDISSKPPATIEWE